MPTETPNDDFTINNTLQDVPPRIMEMHKACKGSREEEESEEESETDADNKKYISEDSGDNSEEISTTAIRTS